MGGDPLSGTLPRRLPAVRLPARQGEAGLGGGLPRLGGEVVTACAKPYQESIVGVVSTHPHLTMGMEFKGKDAVRMALAGRVPVKVSLENGPISPGDALTSASSTPGYAMRATEAGRVVGIAMEGLDLGHSEGATATEESRGVGVITMLVNPHWFGNDLSVKQTSAGLLTIQDTNTLKAALSDLGLRIEEGLLKVGRLEAGAVKADTARVQRLEMVDQSTGDIWCAWIADGQWLKRKGACNATTTPSAGSGQATSAGSGQATTTTQIEEMQGLLEKLHQLQTELNTR